MFVSTAFFTWYNGHRNYYLKEISWIKKAFFIKFFQVSLAAFCIVGSEYDWVEKSKMKVLFVVESVIKRFPDTII